jgi:adenylylsulfate kinase
LHEVDSITKLLDGDSVRTGINNYLDFSIDDRHETIRRISEVSQLFLNNGVKLFNCFISLTKEI